MDSFTLDKLEFDQVRRILARFCRTNLGKEVALRIGPSRKLGIARRWLEETSQMVQALRESGPPPFGGVSDIRPQLERAAPGGGASGDDFNAIAATLEATANLRNWSFALAETLPLVKELAESLPDFKGELHAIRAVVDERGEVVSWASDLLRRTRSEIDTLQQKIRDTIYGYLRQPGISSILQNAVVTLHEDRYVLPVKAERRSELPGVIHRASATGATLFIEPVQSVEMNNRLVAVRDDERREVARLLDELAIQIHRRLPEMQSALRTLGLLDLLTAKAEYAFGFEFTCPDLTEQGSLQLHQVRHPLLIEQAYQQERANLPIEQRHAVVPIDVRLGVDFDILIITGSNTGGKTVSLKTVGLVSVMAQAGLHIPAGRGSRLPLSQDIFLDVGDEQSLEQSLSTFGAHIQRIKHILRHANRSSLVLLDELGSGTDPDEGGAIGQALLDELRHIGCLAMVTTHLGILKAYAFNHERVDNAKVDFDTQTLRPTYHLRIGEPGESHAITVASAIGLPPSVIANARRHLNERGSTFRKAIRATTTARRASEEARTEAHTARMAAEEASREYESKLVDVGKLQQSFENWLASLCEMKEGDEVHVPSLARTGRLVRMEFNKQVALVDLGQMQMEVSLSDLMPQLGQEGIRAEMSNLREKIRTQQREAESLRQEAQRLEKEYRRSQAQQKSRQEQYDQWVNRLGQAKVGEIVPILPPPGTGTLLELDFTKNRAKVLTDAGEMELRLQELFPQTGPFAPPGQGGQRHGRTSHGHGAQGQVHGQASGQPHGQGHPGQGGDEKDRPVAHRRPQSPAAQTARPSVLKLKPGQQVYVVSFHRRATLIRFDEPRDAAYVQAGAFEISVPIADLDVPRETDKPERRISRDAGDTRDS